MANESNSTELHHVVIVGGGFGGLYAAIALGKTPVQVTIIDRENFHLFQPLLYQVATGGLALEDITSPLRSVFSRRENVRVMRAQVWGFDPDARQVLLEDEEPVSYDSLIVAAGAADQYFGNDHWAELAPGMKTGSEALEVRKRIFEAFEEAEWEDDPERQKALMTFVIVGGGPTGVELAGAIGELARSTLVHDFRNVKTPKAKAYLVEGAERVLQAFPPQLSASAEKALLGLGVTVRTGTMVSDIQPGKVLLKSGDSEEILSAETVLWAAGVKASPLGRALAERTLAETDRAGRVVVADDLTVPGHPEIFVLGDLAHFAHGLSEPLPGLAPVAMQEARYAARLIQARLEGRKLPPFVFRDKGTMAVIGRHHAVVNSRWIRLTGFTGWVTWLFLHILYLIEFRNKLLVLAEWAWNYFTRRKGARIITNRVNPPQHPPDI